MIERSVSIYGSRAVIFFDLLVNVLKDLLYRWLLGYHFWSLNLSQTKCYILLGCIINYFWNSKAIRNLRIERQFIVLFYDNHSRE